MMHRGVTLGTIPVSMTKLEIPATGWVDSTVLGTLQFLAGETTGGSISATAVAMTEGVVRMMFLTRLKIVAVTLLALVIGAGGGSAHSYQSSGGRPGDAPAQASEARKETKPAAADLSGQPDSRATDSSDWLRTELHLLATQLKRRQVELEKAMAQRELALAVVTTNQRLNDRRPASSRKRRCA